MRRNLSQCAVVAVTLGCVALGALMVAHGVHGMDDLSEKSRARGFYYMTALGFFLFVGNAAILSGMAWRAWTATAGARKRVRRRLTRALRSVRTVSGRPRRAKKPTLRSNAISPLLPPPPSAPPVPPPVVSRSPAPRPPDATTMPRPPQLRPPKKKRRGAVEPAHDRGERPVVQRTDTADAFRSLRERISPVLPEHLDASTVAAVLFWGFALHGGRPSFGKNYVPYESVCSNACRKGSRHKDVEKCLQWLIRAGVVIIPKRGRPGKTLCSLNPDHGSVEAPWSEVTKSLVAASRSIRLRSG